MPSQTDKNISTNSDLTDSPRDQERMKPEVTIMDLPDVSDIPGQENVVPAPLGELADTTISSADEEGDSIFNTDEDDDLSPGSNVTLEERNDLRRSASQQPDEDETGLDQAGMDSKDDDGAPLNEKGFGQDRSGNDLDVPGADADDADETIGEEDEENNDYSLTDQ